MSARSNKDTKGLVFNIQRFSFHDGPGIRTTVFLKGCPLRCLWCSNPESQRADREIIIQQRKCIRCGKCQNICPQGAVVSSETGPIIDGRKCDLCLLCAQNCPSGALEIVGNVMDVDQVTSEVNKDQVFYNNSGGGVTISGGEPLLQWKFARELLKECKNGGLYTAMDTSGYAPWRVIEAVLPWVDLWLYDVKVLDDQRHKQFVGESNKLILENLNKLCSRARVWLRYPIISGFNNSDSDIERLGQLASSIPIEKISLLPYHQMGKQKYERLINRTYNEGFNTPDESELEDIARRLRDFGVRVTLRA